jgi:NADH-quinone oxidoreductase subunit A
LVRPSRPNYEKLTSYECGEDAVGHAWAQFNARFYIIALIFILFEVEIIFIFPWATVFGNAEKIEQTNGMWGWFSIAEMFLFMTILVIGLAYAWRKGFLDWVKPDPEITDYQSPVPKEMYDSVNRKFEKKH